MKWILMSLVLLLPATMVPATVAFAQEEAPATTAPETEAGQEPEAVTENEPAQPRAEESTPQKETPSAPPTAPAPPAEAPTQADSAESFGPTPADAKDDARDISLGDWERDDWMLVQPELSLLELNGYFRIRPNMFRRLNLGMGEGLGLNSGVEIPSRFPANEQYVEDVSRTNNEGNDANYTGTDMRLRIEPVINVTDKIQVFTTLDILDNVVLGSTPQTYPYFGSGDADARDTPLNVLSRSQQPPVDGVNALRDSILVKRAWARLTALNEQLQLEIGRMPDHWGTGMLINSGDCLDCDFGDVVDRGIVGFKAAGHVFQLAMGIVSSGPVIAPFYDRFGPVYDAARWDDVRQYDLRVQKVDHPDDIRERTLQGESVLNYGLLNAFRMQDDGLNARYYSPTTFDPSGSLVVLDDTGEDFFVRENRDAFLYIGDAFLRFYSRHWTLNLEVAGIVGSFQDARASVDGALADVQVQMLGGSMDAKYNFDGGERSGAHLSFRAGGASGDRGFGTGDGRDAANGIGGFGVLDRSSSQFGVGGDDKLTAFQFSPDKHIDLLLFRRIIGTVSDAWYVSPQLSFFFDRAIEGRATVTYSQTWYKSNVPGGNLPLGLELDGELIIGAPSATPSEGEVYASLAGGALFPLGAFDLGPEDPSSFAWTLQGRLYLTF